MKDLDDKGLIELSLSGDKAAFDVLVERHYPYMFAMAYKWSGNRDNAADITHIAFLKMAENLHRFRHESAFKTWLCRIIINSVKDWNKAQSRRRIDDVSLEDQKSAYYDAEDDVFVREVMMKIHQLPDGERNAILLVCGQGFSHKEAADILGCMEATVSWRIHSGRKKLSDLLEEGHRHG